MIKYPMLRVTLLSLLLLTVGCASNRYNGEASAAKLIAEKMIPAQLSNAALDASGYWLCDPSQRREQARSFDRRYGDRVLKLSAAIKASGKAKSDYIIVTPCKALSRKQSRAELDDFESTLRILEAEVGSASE